MVKYLIVFYSLVFFGCKGFNDGSSFLVEDQIKVIKEGEELSMQTDYSNIGELISTFDFKVKTDNLKDFKDGFIPWADLEDPKIYLSNLDKRDEIVILHNAIKIIIDYPLTKQYEFVLKSDTGFTRGQLLLEISKHYHLLYEQEEKTASVKTIPMDKRTMYNRNETNGKYGIWGHDIADLGVSGITVYKTANDEIVLVLSIES